MSLAVLYCEGVDKSPDIRVIRKILTGVNCMIKAAASKYGLAQKVHFLNREGAVGGVAKALRDRDFDSMPSPLLQKPHDWPFRPQNNQTVQVGWTWERKEIENYLIDPRVVAKTLGKKAPRPEAYDKALYRSACRIANYTAARFALSQHRIRPKPQTNFWGEKRHGFHLPDALDEAACSQGILDVISRHQQGLSVDPDQVVATFHKVLPDFREGGAYFQEFLTYFSGKDLLASLDDEKEVIGFQNDTFRNIILDRLTDAPEDISIWLPEWEALVALVQQEQAK